MPLVIGKSKKPRCFKHIYIEKLPVRYHWNTKSRMMLTIFQDWVNNLNNKMKEEDVKSYYY